MKFFRQLFLALIFSAVTALPVPAHGGLLAACRVAAARISSPFGWLFHAGSEVGRRVVYEHGVVVEERVTWFGLARRIIVTYPDGSVVDFNRTNRTIHDLRHNDFYPERMLDPEAMRNQRVLDFGCGDGYVVETLKRWGIDAHGLDIYLTPKQRKKSHFTMADGQRTPYPDGHFDVVMSTWSAFTYLMHDAASGRPGAREAAVAILREMIRITRRGGVIRLSPVPHIRTAHGVEMPEIEALLREFFPGVRIRAKPDAYWLNRVHHVENIGSSGSNMRLPSEVWVELERVD